MLNTLLNDMTGAAFYVQAALLLFFSVFISVLVREALRPKGEVQRMADLPLRDDADVFPAQEDVK